jgi:hypothetical protein
MTARGKKAALTVSGELAERLKAVVYDYADRMPVAAAIGVLEIVKLEILAEQRE